MMKRLFLVLGILALGAFASAGNVHHKWEIKFKQFAYIWINVGDLSFDLTQNPSGSPTFGYLKALNEVYPATLDGFNQCLQTPSFGSSVINYNATLSSSTASTVCYFAPIISSGGSNYDATYDDPDTSSEDFQNVADADLLVLTYDTSWTLQASVTSGSVPAGVELAFYPYAWDPDSDGDSEDNVLEDTSGAAKSLNDAKVISSTTSTPPTLSTGFGSGTNANAYRVRLTSGIAPFLYLQPVNFALKVDLASALASGDIDLTGSNALEVTYTVSNP